jgi:hypothetical protein
LFGCIFFAVSFLFLLVGVNDTVSICPACEQEGIPPKGRKDAKYLLVFNKPYPVQPAVTSKYKKQQLSGLDVLRKELQKVGLDLNYDFRMTWLYLHEPGKNEGCYKVGREIVLDEAKGKQAVVLVGAEPVEEFTRLSASDVYGLQVESPTFSAPITFVIPKPEGVFVRGSGIGELRLSVQKLERLLSK